MLITRNQKEHALMPNVADTGVTMDVKVAGGGSTSMTVVQYVNTDGDCASAPAFAIETSYLESQVGAVISPYGSDGTCLFSDGMDSEDGETLFRPDVLIDEYGLSGSHPAYSQSDWRQYVLDGGLLGYWQWVSEHLMEDSLSRSTITTSLTVSDVVLCPIEFSSSDVELMCLSLRAAADAGQFGLSVGAAESLIQNCVNIEGVCTLSLPVRLLALLHHSLLQCADATGGNSAEQVDRYHHLATLMEQALDQQGNLLINVPDGRVITMLHGRFLSESGYDDEGDAAERLTAVLSALNESGRVVTLNGVPDGFDCAAVLNEVDNFLGESLSGFQILS